MGARVLIDEEITAWEAVSSTDDNHRRAWTNGDMQRAIATIRQLQREDTLARILNMQHAFRARLNHTQNRVNPETAWQIWQPGDPPQDDQNLAIIEHNLGYYATCLSQEAAELRDWTRWKQWSRQLGNKHPTIKIGTPAWVEEVRFELVDLFCFLNNAMAWAGLFTASAIFSYYCRKVSVNHERQDTGVY